VLVKELKTGGLGFIVATWGLIQTWNKDTVPNHFLMFNARSETAHEKPSFRELLKSKRCVIAVEGYFEWVKSGKKKEPHFITLDRPMFVAGLFEFHPKHKFYSFAVLTQSSPDSIKSIHERCPVVLSTRQDVKEWLSVGLALDEVIQHTPLRTQAKSWIVDSKMSVPSYQGSDTTRPLVSSKAANGSTPRKMQAGISAFFPASPPSTSKEVHTLVQKRVKSALGSSKLEAAFQRQKDQSVPAIAESDDMTKVVIDLTDEGGDDDDNDNDDDDDDGIGDVHFVGQKRARNG